MFKFLSKIFKKELKPITNSDISHLLVPKGKIEKKLNEIEELIVKAKQYNEGLIQVNIELQKMYYLLDSIIYAAGGYLWCKDVEGCYIYCDRQFCEDFFRLAPHNSICPVQGKTDLELISLFKEKTGKEHTFGQVCISTDKITLAERKRCRFIEVGYIGDNIFPLDVVKNPFIVGGEIKGVVGLGKRIEESKWGKIKDYLYKKIEEGDEDIKILNTDKRMLVFRIYNDEKLCID